MNDQAARCSPLEPHRALWPEIGKWVLGSLAAGIAIGTLKAVALLGSTWSPRLMSQPWAGWLTGDFLLVSGGLWLVAFLYGLWVAWACGCPGREALWKVSAISFGLFLFAGLALSNASHPWAAQHGAFVPEIGRWWRWAPVAVAFALGCGLYTRSWGKALIALVGAAVAIAALFGTWVVNDAVRPVYLVGLVIAVGAVYGIHRCSWRAGLLSTAIVSSVVLAAWVLGHLTPENRSGSPYAGYCITMPYGLGIVGVAALSGGVARRSLAAAAVAAAAGAIALAMTETLSMISNEVGSVTDMLRVYLGPASLLSPRLPGFTALSWTGPVEGYGAWREIVGGAALGGLGGLIWWATGRTRAVPRLLTTVAAGGVCGIVVASLLRAPADAVAEYTLVRGGVPGVRECALLGALTAAAVVIAGTAFGLLNQARRPEQPGRFLAFRCAGVVTALVIVAAPVAAYAYTSLTAAAGDKSIFYRTGMTRHDYIVKQLWEYWRAQYGTNRTAKIRVPGDIQPVVALDFSRLRDHQVPYEVDPSRRAHMLDLLLPYRNESPRTDDRLRALSYLYREQASAWQVDEELKTARVAWRDYGEIAWWSRGSIIQTLMALRRWKEAARDLEALIAQGYVVRIWERDRTGRAVSQVIGLYGMDYGMPEQMLARCYEMMGRWDECLTFARRALKMVRHPPDPMLANAEEAVPALEAQIARVLRARKDGIRQWSGSVSGSVRLGSRRVSALAILWPEDNTKWVRYIRALAEWAPASYVGGFCRTDRNGGFRFDHLAAGTYCLVLRFRAEPPVDGCVILRGPQRIVVNQNTVALDPIQFVPAVRCETPAPGATVQATNPTLSWFPHPRAAYYRIILGDECEDRVWESGPVVGTSVLVSADGFVASKAAAESWRGGLVPGKWYQWVVYACDASGHVISTSQDYRLVMPKARGFTVAE